MEWKNHNSLMRGSHSFLSPSKYHWINYTPEKLVESYRNHAKAALGTRLHSLAEEHIHLGVRMADDGEAISAFVNDAISIGMTPEVVLFYSPNAYGTTDAIFYENGILRIHDLKTGVTVGNIEQLMVYAALFVLDYGERPTEFNLRIYQGNTITEHQPIFEEVNEICDTIIAFDRLIEEVKAQAIL